jgi:glycosyltransferase involved in cell wall biosynthesis
MHVAVANLTRGGFSGGYRKYLQVLIPLLRRDPRVSRVDVYMPESDRPTVVEADVMKRWDAGDYKRGYPELKRWLAESPPDVVFVPTAQTIACGKPVVSMIRNMEPLLVPFDGNVMSEGLRNLARAWAARRAATRSDRVIAVSQHVRDFLVSRWKLDPEKIGVVYHGVDRVASPRRPAAAVGIEPNTFLFTAGSIRPARGLEDLLGALAILGPGHTLLIAGEPDPITRGHAAKLKARAASLGARVVWLGRLDEQEMAWCFQNCTFFVMTSRAEACPNTVLEALTYGCVSISTDCPPMPEFFADAALYYRARDAKNLAARIAGMRAMTEEERATMRERAIARAGDFSWERTASQTVTELELAT